MDEVRSSDHDQWRQATSAKPPRTKAQAASFKLDKAVDLGYSGSMSSRTLKPIFQRGGSRRQEILDQAVEMIASRSGGTQQDKMHFCTDNLGMDSTEYMECLNRASNGGLVKSALGWNQPSAQGAAGAPGKEKKIKAKTKQQITEYAEIYPSSTW